MLEEMDPQEVPVSRPEPDNRTRTITLVILTMAAFLNPFTGSSIDLALPLIAEEFSVSAVMLSWVPSAYLLSMLIFMLPAGRLGDCYGRVSVFRAGVVIYTVATGLIVFIPSIFALLLLRFIQGIGSAMVFSTITAIISDLYPAGERGRALGINVTAVYLGLSLGPFLGGVLTQYFGWRSIFAVTLIIAGIVMATFHRIPAHLNEACRGGLDFPGAALTAGILLALFLGLSRIPSPGALLFLAAAAVLIPLLARVERNAPAPLIPLDLLRKNRIFTYSNAAALINYAATFAVALLMSLYLQYIRGLEPAAAGSILFLQPLVQVICSPVAGRMSDRIEPAVLASCGMMVSAVSLLGLAFLTPVTPMAVVMALIMILGCGLAFFSSPNTNAVMSSVERSQYGIASAVLSTCRDMGMAFSMGVVMVTFAIFLGQQQIEPALYPELMAAIRLIFAVFFVLSLAGAALSWRRRELRTAD
ncbi:MAG: major facilitator transporter [Methanomicrobiales archaeon]|nr:major facilitator transporter [Methanomicrobiales archaeon]